MIVRIMGEGQWKLDDSHLEQLNKVDADLEKAVTGSDQQGFEQHFGTLLGIVREHGKPLDDSELADSDVILPPSDSSLAEMRELISGDGLIAG